MDYTLLFVKQILLEEFFFVKNLMVISEKVDSGVASLSGRPNEDVCPPVWEVSSHQGLRL